MQANRLVKMPVTSGQWPVTSRGDRPRSLVVERHHPDGALRGVPAQGVDAYRLKADSGVGGAAPSSPCHFVTSPQFEGERGVARYARTANVSTHKRCAASEGDTAYICIHLRYFPHM